MAIVTYLSAEEREQLTIASYAIHSKELNELYRDVCTLYPNQFYIRELKFDRLEWILKKDRYLYTLYSVMGNNTSEVQVINLKGTGDPVDEFTICAFFYGLLSPLNFKK